MFQLYHYRAKCLRIIDGDTCRMSVELGYHITVEETFRLLGINAPEMHGETKEAAIRAKSYLEFLLKLKESDVLTITTKKDPDHFGRYLAEIYITSDDGHVMNVNQTMITSGNAIPYRP